MLAFVIVVFVLSQYKSSGNVNMLEQLLVDFRTAKSVIKEGWDVLEQLYTLRKHGRTKIVG